MKFNKNVAIFSLRFATWQMNKTFELSGGLSFARSKIHYYAYIWNVRLVDLINQNEPFVFPISFLYNLALITTPCFKYFLKWEGQRVCILSCSIRWSKIQCPPFPPSTHSLNNCMLDDTLGKSFLTNSFDIFIRILPLLWVPSSACWCVPFGQKSLGKRRLAKQKRGKKCRCYLGAWYPWRTRWLTAAPGERGLIHWTGSREFGYEEVSDDLGIHLSNGEWRADCELQSWRQRRAAVGDEITWRRDAHGTI